MEIPLDIFITFTANDCEYEGITNELIFQWVHPLFLKNHDEGSNEENPNWNHAMNGPFADKCWWVACTQLETLELMGAWDVFYHDYDMNAIMLE